MSVCLCTDCLSVLDKTSRGRGSFFDSRPAACPTPPPMKRTEIHLVSRAVDSLTSPRDLHALFHRCCAHQRLDTYIGCCLPLLSDISPTGRAPNTTRRPFQPLSRPLGTRVCCVCVCCTSARTGILPHIGQSRPEPLAEICALFEKRKADPLPYFSALAQPSPAQPNRASTTFFLPLCSRLASSPQPRA